MPAIYLRAATADDEAVIRRMIREARLNPFGLHWPRFIVAEDAAAPGLVVGIGQIKVLGDGTRELASLAVLPDYQGTGVGSALAWTLIALAPGPLYLRCGAHNESYYPRFGFRTLAPDEMPRPLRRFARLINTIVPVINLFTDEVDRLVIMGRGADPADR